MLEYDPPGGPRGPGKTPNDAAGWRLARTLLKVASGPTLVATADGEIEAANAALCSATGFRAEGLIGNPLRTLVAFRFGERPPGGAFPDLGASGEWSGDGRLRLADGSHLDARVRVNAIRDERGEVSRCVVSLRPGSKVQKLTIPAQNALDTLTGLPKWGLMHSILETTLREADRRRGEVAVMLFEPGNARTINKILGHKMGRRLQALVARRLEGGMRGRDILSRLSGDTFGLIFPGTKGAKAVRTLSDRILRTLRAPFALDGQEFFVQGHLGIAVYPRDGTEADTLLRNAEVALDQAKDASKCGYAFYTAEMHQQACRRAAIESALHHAVDRGQLKLHYQPQIHAPTGRIVGAEALVRWRHPNLGAVPPSAFIPIAEETGLIVDIGEWVLRTAVEQYQTWLRQGIRLPKLGVNVSALQLYEGRLVELVEAVLAKATLGGGIIELELTESAVLQTGAQNLGDLARLRGLGVRLSIDDFGTGYSSLNYLNRFPVDGIKIDRSFVSDLPKSDDNAAVVTAIVDMAENLRLAVVAEGVETEEQLSCVRRLG